MCSIPQSADAISVRMFVLFAPSCALSSSNLLVLRIVAVRVFVIFGIVDEAGISDGASDSCKIPLAPDRRSDADAVDCSWNSSKALRLTNCCDATLRSLVFGPRRTSSIVLIAFDQFR